MQRWLWIVCLFLFGCSTYEFTPYVGPQKHWPQSEGTFVKKVAGVDIYTGANPNRPYKLLGRVIGESDYAVAICAKQHHADAVIIRHIQSHDGGSVSLPSTSQTYYTSSSTLTTHSPGLVLPVDDVTYSGYIISYTPYPNGSSFSPDDVPLD